MPPGASAPGGKNLRRRCVQRGRSCAAEDIRSQRPGSRKRSPKRPVIGRAWACFSLVDQPDLWGLAPLSPPPKGHRKKKVILKCPSVRTVDGSSDYTTRRELNQLEQVRALAAESTGPIRGGHGRPARSQFRGSRPRQAIRRRIVGPALQATKDSSKLFITRRMDSKGRAR